MKLYQVQVFLYELQESFSNHGFRFLYCCMKKISFHIIAWVCFFLTWSQVVYYFIKGEPNRLLFSFLDTLSIILSFYSVSYITKVFFYRTNKNLFFIFCILSISLNTLLMIILMKFNLRTPVIPISFTFNWSYEKMIYNRVLLVILGSIFAVMATLSFAWFNNKQKMNQLEKLSYKAELNSLKAQLNPHFLFNSLNSI
ncbi:MAG: hypothetical protein JWN76_583, partial [Chitinophagaceae bacterium]|nr:hypothetical protein [Chitinophagaceae bacterium]